MSTEANCLGILSRNRIFHGWSGMPVGLVAWLKNVEVQLLWVIVPWASQWISSSPSNSYAKHHLWIPAFYYRELGRCTLGDFRKEKNSRSQILWCHNARHGWKETGGEGYSKREAERDSMLGWTLRGMLCWIPQESSHKISDGTTTEQQGYPLSLPQPCSTQGQGNLHKGKRKEIGKTAKPGHKGSPWGNTQGIFNQLHLWAIISLYLKKKKRTQSPLTIEGSTVRKWQWQNRTRPL